MRRPLLIATGLAAAAAIVWFMIAGFPGLAEDTAREVMPPILAGGPARQNPDADRIVAVAGTVVRVDTTARGLRLILRGSPDTARTIIASIDSGAALARRPLPAPGTLARITGLRVSGDSTRLALRPVLSIEIVR